MEKIRMSPNVFDKRAKEYAAKNMDTSLYHDTFDTFCNCIAREDAAVLELACGPGNITQYLLSRKPAYQILGTDLAPAMIELAKVNNPTASFQLMDMGGIRTLGKKFDAIICGFGLPYLSKEEAIQLIADAAAILGDGGVLYLSTMEDDYSKSGMQTSSSGDKLFIHYHQADYLLHALEANGFQLLAEQHLATSNDDVAASIDLVLIAKK